MTLDKPVRGVVRTALDVDIIHDDVVRAIEGDDELTHLSRAVHELELAGMCGPESDTEQGLHAETVDGALLLAERRVKQLLETDEAREGSA